MKFKKNIVLKTRLHQMIAYPNSWVEMVQRLCNILIWWKAFLTQEIKLMLKLFFFIFVNQFFDLLEVS